MAFRPNLAAGLVYPASLVWRLRASTLTSSLIFSGLLACPQNGPVARFLPAAREAKQSTASSVPFIVIGFVGGFVRRDDMVHSPVQLAARIRADYPSGVYIKVFENRHREEAHQEILKILDSDHNGSLSNDEKRNARIILYGMSWGGSETLELARQLDAENIPVLLSVQVDSVAKRGQNDRVIPANVREAVNFYQTEGLLHGTPEIRAADPSRTRILGNYRYEYGSKPLECPDYPWYDRLFTKSHTEIECDPIVWSRVESLIQSKLPPAAQGKTH